MKLPCYLSLFACIAPFGSANTEKVIFVASDISSLPNPLRELEIDTLVPSQPVLRRALPVAFPGETGNEKVLGEASWYLVTQLNPRQRYEIRICWAAIQPTEFSLDTFEPQDFLENPILLRQLQQYSQGQSKPSTTIDHSPGSHLLLRVTSTADFYTTNKTLMRNPPPVDVDIILDPFIANIFPASLLPIAGYILVLAVLSWPISQLIWSLLQPGSSTIGQKSHTT